LIITINGSVGTSSTGTAIISSTSIIIITF
jgi:hypothetical protein